MTVCNISCTFFLRFIIVASHISKDIQLHVIYGNEIHSPNFIKKRVDSQGKKIKGFVCSISNGIFNYFFQPNDEEESVKSSNSRSKLGSRLSVRNGRSVVHKNLEDNYGAVISANHEALAQILEQVKKTVNLLSRKTGQTCMNVTYRASFYSYSTLFYCKWKCEIGRLCHHTQWSEHKELKRGIVRDRGHNIIWSIIGIF